MVVQCFTFLKTRYAGMEIISYLDTHAPEGTSQLRMCIEPIADEI